MIEYKVEGDIFEDQTDVKSTSIGGEGFIRRGEDRKLSTVEKQLRDAENTLKDLKALKRRLEREKEEKSSEQVDSVSVKELKQENEYLKSEISALKNVVDSLRENFLQSTKQVQNEVQKSIRILESASVSPPQMPPRKGHVEEIRPESKDKSFSVTPEEERKIVPVKRTDEKSVELGIDNSEDKYFRYKKDLAELEKNPAVEIEDEVQEEAKLPVEPVKEEVPAPVKQAEEPKKLEAEEVKKAEVKVESTEEKPAENVVQENQVEDDPEIKGIEEELDEYQKIQAELEALYQGNSSEENVEKNIPTIAETKPEEKKIEAAPVNTQAAQNVTKAVEPAPAPQPAAEPIKAAEPKAEEKPVEAPKPEESFKKTFWPQGQTQEQKGEKKEPTKEKKKGISLFKKKEKREKKESLIVPNEEDQNKQGMSGAGKLAIRASIFIFLLLGAGAGYRIYNADTTREIYITQAKNSGAYQAADPSANIPSELPTAPPEERYKEAFVDLPFDQTIWSTHKDSEMGISIDYPQNTSYRLRPVSGTNLWFLRKNGYLLKIERVTSDLTLDQYVSTNKSEIDYKVENTTFKNLPAIHLIQNEYLDVRGNVFVVKVDNTIFKIWYKTYVPDENPDDEKRVTKMLDSLVFTNVKANKK